MDAAAAELDEEEHVEPLQRDRLDGEEVDGKHALRLCPQESTPREPGSLAGRADAAWRRIFLTVVAETVRPRPFISPTIRW